MTKGSMRTIFPNLPAAPSNLAFTSGYSLSKITQVHHIHHDLLCALRGFSPRPLRFALSIQHNDCVPDFLKFVALALLAIQPHPKPTFHKDVLPILRQRCQTCHRPNEIAPMPLVTYEQSRRWATQIRDTVRSKSMPPWFADPCCGHFANDPSLTAEEIATLSAWAEAHAPAGNPHDAPPPHWTTTWNIPQPDEVVSMPKPVTIPAHGDVEYTYEIVPTNFAEDKWVQMS